MVWFQAMRLPYRSGSGNRKDPQPPALSTSASAVSAAAHARHERFALRDDIIRVASTAVRCATGAARCLAAAIVPICLAPRKHRGVKVLDPEQPLLFDIKHTVRISHRLVRAPFIATARVAVVPRTTVADGIWCVDVVESGRDGPKSPARCRGQQQRVVRWRAAWDKHQQLRPYRRARRRRARQRVLGNEVLTLWALAWAGGIARAGRLVSSTEGGYPAAARVRGREVADRHRGGHC
jgi:hypothetical protein